MDTTRVLAFSFWCLSVLMSSGLSLAGLAWLNTNSCTASHSASPSPYIQAVSNSFERNPSFGHSEKAPNRNTCMYEQQVSKGSKANASTGQSAMSSITSFAWIPEFPTLRWQSSSQYLSNFATLARRSGWWLSPHLWPSVSLKFAIAMPPLRQVSRHMLVQKTGQILIQIWY